MKPARRVADCGDDQFPEVVAVAIFSCCRKMSMETSRVGVDIDVPPIVGANYLIGNARFG